MMNKISVLKRWIKEHKNNSGCLDDNCQEVEVIKNIIRFLE